MKIITLSGVDGSGKSTQLALLRQHLEAQGNTVAYFHAIEFSSANRIARLFKKDSRFTPGKEAAITTASWCSVVLREKFLFLDFVRFHFFLRKLKKEGYDYLLSDRSFYDSLVNLSYLSYMSFPRKRESPLFRFWIPAFAGMTRLGILLLEALLPKADIAFYLDINPEDIMRRDRAPEQGADYLRAKISLFKKKIPTWNLLVIDASRPKETIAEDILDSMIRNS